MKKIFFICLSAATMLLMQNCRTVKKINKAIAPRDSTANKLPNSSAADSLKIIQETMAKFHSHYINYKTFNAKIKVQYEDNNGKTPNLLAVVRIMKDSAIWISLSVPIINQEVFRMLISKDSVTLMDIRNKQVLYRSLDYLQDVTEIPFDYKTLQDLIIGNPIFFDDTVVSYKKLNDKILVFTVGNYFKNLLTISADDNLLLHSKLDDIDAMRNRTADITYANYENKDGVDFSTYREITVSEKNKLDIRFNYKQYEFNKELSVSFRVPPNYKKK